LDSTQLITTPGRRLLPKLKDKTPSPDPDSILKKLTDRTVDFQRAVGLARDQTIETTAYIAEYTGIKLAQVHGDVIAAKNHTVSLARDGEMARNTLENMDRTTTELGRDITYLRTRSDETAAYRERENEQNNRRDKELRQWIAQCFEQMTARARREAALEDDSLQARNEMLKMILEAKST
jgi:hypothetical protein